jgi:Saccharopine dehydrogenase NADP binding domain
MTSSDRIYDLVVFGASGFTGARILAHACKQHADWCAVDFGMQPSRIQRASPHHPIYTLEDTKRRPSCEFEGHASDTACAQVAYMHLVGVGRGRAQSYQPHQRLWHCRRTAAAGRTESKLESAVAEHCSGSEKMQRPALMPNIDVQDAASLAKMAQSARLVLSAVGPYRHYGEPVVKACVEAGTDYVDVCGEPGARPCLVPLALATTSQLCLYACFSWRKLPATSEASSLSGLAHVYLLPHVAPWDAEFMERMQLEYHDAARASGCFVVSAAGFDCIPAEVGAALCCDALAAQGDTPHHVDSRLTLDWGTAGMVGHFATYESAVYGFGSTQQLRDVRKKLRERGANAPPPVPGTPVPKPLKCEWKAGWAAWALPFPVRARHLHRTLGLLPGQASLLLARRRCQAL